MVAFLRAAAALAAAAMPRSPVAAPPTARETPIGLDPQIVRVWSRMVLAHAHSP
ncbi:hypothetical protein [Streptomyces sp. NTH33]|uniref:hypothetical protein n=1 Tax=Streptomyces sp. NTH33 TaxID=1735453 RepID=UPI0015E8DAC8|nr:hypothetical protein [Streptomyces sp. NTH33]